MNKKNYKSIRHLKESILNQLNNFMKDKLSNILTGFQKGHSAEQSLLIMTEKWKRNLR